MARKDTILKSFLNHPIVQEKFAEGEPTPESVRDGLNSNIPIVKAIALIVEHSESSNTGTDAGLYRTVTQYLNSVSI